MVKSTVNGEFSIAFCMFTRGYPYPCAHPMTAFEVWWWTSDWSRFTRFLSERRSTRGWSMEWGKSMEDLTRKNGIWNIWPQKLESARGTGCFSMPAWIPPWKCLCPANPTDFMSTFYLKGYLFWPPLQWVSGYKASFLALYRVNCVNGTWVDILNGMISCWVYLIAIPEISRKLIYHDSTRKIRHLCTNVVNSYCFNFRYNIWRIHLFKK